MYGDPIELIGADLMARCVQHETDHLDGIIFIDRLGPEERKEAMREIRASEWFGDDLVVKTSPHAISQKWM